jgi:hypothetical protein
VASSFIDYEDRAVKRFVNEYQLTYHTDPLLLGFQGFDIACYFLTALKNYGTNIQRCLGEMQINSMQTHFDFRQVKNGGFENQHWTVIKYNNYRLLKVN